MQRNLSWGNAINGCFDNSTLVCPQPIFARSVPQCRTQVESLELCEAVMFIKHLQIRLRDHSPVNNKDEIIVAILAQNGSKKGYGDVWSMDRYAVMTYGTKELRKSQMNSISRGYWSGGMEGDRLGPGSGPISPEISPKCRMNCGAQTTIEPPLNHHWTMSSDAFTKTEASKHQTWGACLAKVTTVRQWPFMPPWVLDFWFRDVAKYNTSPQVRKGIQHGIDFLDHLLICFHSTLRIFTHPGSLKIRTLFSPGSLQKAHLADSRCFSRSEPSIGWLVSFLRGAHGALSSGQNATLTELISWNQGMAAPTPAWYTDHVF